MCPWSGRIDAVVRLVIVAFSRFRLTWTVVPLTVAPSAGWVMVSVAGDEGRGPKDSDADAGPLAGTLAGALAGALAGGDDAPARLQARTTSASATDSNGFIGSHPYLCGQRAIRSRSARCRSRSRGKCP